MKCAGLLGLALLLPACATPPASPASPAVEAAAAPAAPVPPAPATPPASVPVQSSEPLDASRLPPFEGEHRVLSDPLRGVARLDHTIPPEDLWERIRRGFAVPDLDNERVKEKTAYYAARPEYLQRVFDRSRLYLFHIVQELEKRGLPTELALLPMVESAFNPMAYSRSHASGLWQ
ncbi:MAG TPA: transglycosylase SLT domain-containing protein, partial [Burkholderiales bacterium]|nr:transglycosylase SLT domain-containing protein [Burkholderiales bacterium]